MSGALIFYLAGLPLVLLIAALFVTREGARRGDGLLVVAMAATWPAFATVVMVVMACDAVIAAWRLRP